MTDVNAAHLLEVVGVEQDSGDASSHGVSAVVVLGTVHNTSAVLEVFLDVLGHLSLEGFSVQGENKRVSISHVIDILSASLARKSALKRVFLLLFATCNAVEGIVLFYQAVKVESSHLVDLDL